MDFGIRVYICSMLLLHSSHAFSETVWISRLFKPSDGLTYQIVRDIAKAPEGMIWFATWGGGLSRFDGSTWETLNEQIAVSDYMTRCLAFDHRGGLWVGTMEGIRYFNGQQWTSFTTQNTPGLVVDSVFTILPRSNGTIWFGMVDGYLYSYDPSRLEASPWHLECGPETFENKSIRSMIEMDDGSVWLGAKHIYHFNGEEWTEYPQTQSVYSLCKTIDGTIYAAASQNVLQFTGNTWDIVEEAGNKPRSVASTSEGTVLVGTQVGLRILQNGTWRDVTLSGKPTAPYVETIRTFDDGSIWVGTRNGVYLIRQSDWSKFPYSTGIIGENAKGFYTSTAIPPRTIAHDGRILEFKQDEWVPLGIVGDNPQRLDSIIDWNNDRILAYNTTEIVECNARDFSIARTIPIPKAIRVNQIHLTMDGQIILHGLNLDRPEYGAGEDWLYCWTGLEWQPYEAVERYKDREIQIYRITRDGTQWIAFNDSVVPLGNPYPHLDIFSSPRFRGHLVTDIIVSRDGSAWFGSSGAGIFVLDGNHVTNFTTRNGLPSDWILCLFESADGTIWAGMDDSTVASFREGRWITFSREDFELDGRVAQIFEDANGAMWFAVRPDGVVRYKPSANPPDTVIDVSPNLVVPKGMGIFSFHGWDAWHTTPAQELVFSWRLVHGRAGSEVVPWTPYSALDTVSTPPLDPGEYRFEVRGADRERNIDQTPAQIAFTVEPYFFMRPSFLTTLCLVVVLVFYMGYRWYLAHRQLVNLAQIDKLTNAYKRDYFSLLFEMELKRAKRYGRDLSLLLLDIDHFKAINDRYGHDVGDEVLQAGARRFAGQIRDIDLLGRWGGDEFIFLLPETACEEARKIAERIRNDIQQAALRTKQGTITCTVSIGAVHLNGSADTIDTLVKAADIALYRAKERGRNRVDTY